MLQMLNHMLQGYWQSPSPLPLPDPHTKWVPWAQALCTSRQKGGCFLFSSFYAHTYLYLRDALQVEHGITEMVSGVDLVAWQLELQGEGCSMSWLAMLVTQIMKTFVVLVFDSRVLCTLISIIIYW